MTKKEMHVIKAEALYKNYKWKEGYVCYQTDKLSTHDLLKVGSNYGVYGWNWSLYLHPETKTFYLSYYRNI